MKIDNKGYESDIENEHIEMHVDLKIKHCSNVKTTVSIGAMSILLLSTPWTEQQTNSSYLHSQFHTWLKLVLAMWTQILQNREKD